MQCFAKTVWLAISYNVMYLLHNNYYPSESVCEVDQCMGVPAEEQSFLIWAGLLRLGQVHLLSLQGSSDLRENITKLGIIMHAQANSLVCTKLNFLPCRHKVYTGPFLLP